MRKIREVLRLHYELGLRNRAVSAAVGISKGSVSDYLRRAQGAGLTWSEAREMSDAEVEQRLFKTLGRNEPPERAPVDFGWVHRELSRPGVTLQLLWSEYCEAAAHQGAVKPYQYSHFCDLYREYRSHLNRSMRQVHRAGEKAFLDFSGKKLRLMDRGTGEVRDVELFVMVLGASNYTYAEAVLSQKVSDFVGATVRGLEFFGGAPAVLVPDQLRSAVSSPSRYEPELNTTYAEMGQHYGIAIVPARPRKPKDKAKVETAVLIVQRWIVARLRNRTFFTLADLNQAIRELVEELNRRPFKKLEGCRRSAFESLDRPALKPLPLMRYEVSEWKEAKVNIDYHIEYDHRIYSVPCALVGQRVEIRATATLVELFHGGTRVASHPRSYGPRGTATTLEEHRPRSHREYGAWPPERLLGWAQKAGEATAQVAEAILKRWPHPESGYRSCHALLRMGHRYGPARLESACARALQIGNPTRKSVEAILKRGLDQVATEGTPEARCASHENIRGPTYFDREEDGDFQPVMGTHSTLEDRSEQPIQQIETNYLNEERIGIKYDSRLDYGGPA